MLCVVKVAANADNAGRHPPIGVVMRHQPLPAEALDQLFLAARTHNANPNPWLDRVVPDSLLEQVWNLARMGPTAANTSPARVVWVKSAEAKAKLDACLDEGNRPKTMAAPVTAIVGMDYRFFDRLDFLYPVSPNAKSWFDWMNDEQLLPVVMRNSSLQGAYLMIAARALGLDCAPMSGFNSAKIDEAFFAGTNVRSNFIFNLGYGDDSKLYPRGPRLSFDEACRIA